MPNTIYQIPFFIYKNLKTHLRNALLHVIKKFFYVILLRKCGMKNVIFNNLLLNTGI